MNAKKILCLLSAGTILTAAAPAFADPHRWEPRHDRRHAQKRVVVVERHFHAPVRRVFVERPVYIERRPVYVVQQAPVYYGPEPVYAGYGAAVGSQIGKGSGNTAAIAIGAVVGGILGSGR
jgi:uncharacterized protein YcfJ